MCDLKKKGNKFVDTIH
jgi:RsiW-degrading membrane proteinase PrsW (M82 family)